MYEEEEEEEKKKERNSITANVINSFPVTNLRRKKFSKERNFFLRKNVVRNIVDVDEFFRSSDESRRRDFAVKFCTGVVNPDIKSWTVSGLRSLGVSVCGDEKKKERKKKKKKEREVARSG